MHSGVKSKFILCLHRFGNSHQHLQLASTLQKKLETHYPLQVYVECDVKWLYANNRMIFYVHHGIMIPGTKVDLIRSVDTLKKKVETGKILLLKELLHRYKNLRFMIHLKQGVGDETQAFKQLKSLLSVYQAQHKVMLLSSSLHTTRLLKQYFSHQMVGSFHRWSTKHRVLHLPDYAIPSTVARYGILPKQQHLSSDFVIVPHKKNNTLPYLVGKVKSKRALSKALRSEAIGACIYANRRSIHRILGPLEQKQPVPL